MDKSNFINEYEKEIVVFMYRFGDKISTRAIAKEVKIHWKTAKKNLEILEKKGIINKVSLGNKILWGINANFKRRMDMKQKNA